MIGHGDATHGAVELPNVVQRGDGCGIGAVGASADFLDDAEGEELYLPADAGDAEAVVSHGPDDAGDMGAVAGVVHGVVVGLDGGFGRALADEVPTTVVIHLVIAVVIDAIGLLAAAGLACVGPHVGG